MARGGYTFSTIAEFTGSYGTQGGYGGFYPYGGVTLDAQGNLYGANLYGGSYGAGTVYMVANDAARTLTTLASFDYANGAEPYSGVTLDAQGNLYGTTRFGGSFGAGTVYMVANDAARTLTTLASFDGPNSPYADGRVTLDAQGNLYGTTSQGGASGVGTVYMVANDAARTLTTLASFDGANGSSPLSGVTLDAQGNLYGTTTFGGAFGVGTVFMVANDAARTLTTLASFDYSNGSVPLSGVTLDAQGNLYGTTSQGGAFGYGTVYMVANDAARTLTTLASFDRFVNGYASYAALSLDAQGNIYGTNQSGPNGGGTVFMLTRDASAVATPEPATLALALVGIPAGLLVSRRIGRRAACIV